MYAVERLLEQHRRWQVKTLHHSNPDDPQGPPDVELFWHGGSTDLVTGDGPAKRGWYWWHVPERYIAHGPFPYEEAALDNAQMKDPSVTRADLLDAEAQQQLRRSA
jgi:hypothetical protein